MGVEIDESGCDEQAGRVDLALTGFGDGADRGDDTVGHGDVAAVRRTAQAVDDRAVADDQVVTHGLRLRRLQVWEL